MPGRKRKGETTTNQTEPPQKKGAAVAPSSPEQNGPSVLHTDSVGTLTLETGHKVTGIKQNEMRERKMGRGEVLRREMRSGKKKKKKY